MEYKVLTQQDRRWSGKFSPETLEHTLNSYAAEGWRVVSTFPVASPWTISTSQVMILLERDSGQLTRSIHTRATPGRYAGDWRPESDPEEVNDPFRARHTSRVAAQPKEE